jgi:predicted phosphodiesterase
MITKLELRVGTDIKAFVNELERFAAWYVHYRLETELINIKVVKTPPPAIEVIGGAGVPDVELGINFQRRIKSLPGESVSGIDARIAVSRVGGEFPLLVEFGPYAQDARQFVVAFMKRCESLWSTAPLVDPTAEMAVVPKPRQAGETPEPLQVSEETQTPKHDTKMKSKLSIPEWLAALGEGGIGGSATTIEIPIPLEDLDAATQRHLPGLAPGWVDPQREIDGSEVVYKLSQRDLGDLGELRLCRLTAKATMLNLSSVPRPTEDEVLEREAQRIFLHGGQTNLDKAAIRRWIVADEDEEVVAFLDKLRGLPRYWQMVVLFEGTDALAEMPAEPWETIEGTKIPIAKAIPFLSTLPFEKFREVISSVQDKLRAAQDALHQRREKHRREVIQGYFNFLRNDPMWRWVETAQPTPPEPPQVSDGRSEQAGQERADQHHYTQAEGGGIHILHLSDIHLEDATQAQVYRTQLETDLIQELKIKRLEYLVISGDVANHSTEEEYRAAFEMLDGLINRFGLDADRVIIVPGNHDINWDDSEAAYLFVPKRKPPESLLEGKYIPAGEAGVLLREEAPYQQRFARFNTEFYKRLYGGREYPLDYAKQAILVERPDDHILFLALNSSWQVDHHFLDRASINMQALSNALDRLQGGKYNGWLKIAVWHHPVTGKEMINDEFMQLLAVHGFQVCLHGHIHEAIGDFHKYDDKRGIHIIGAGTFGAPTREQAPGIPLQYNLLTFDPQRGEIVVNTRKKEKPNGAWSADARWGDTNDPKPRYSFQVRNYQPRK